LWCDFWCCEEVEYWSPQAFFESAVGLQTSFFTLPCIPAHQPLVSIPGSPLTKCDQCHLLGPSPVGVVCVLRPSTFPKTLAKKSVPVIGPRLRLGFVSGVFVLSGPRVQSVRCFEPFRTMLFRSVVPADLRPATPAFVQFFVLMLYFSPFFPVGEFFD